MYKRIKNYLKDESKGYTIIRTYYERPRLFLVGWLYVFGVLVILSIGAILGVFASVFAPLAVLEPIAKFFINMDTGEPRNILGWGFIALILIAIIAAFIGLCLPGLYLVVNYQKLIDKEWPDDPNKTQRWRDKYAD